MSDLRSSQQQLKEEFGQLYREMTDSVELDKAKRKKKRQDALNDMKADYGF